MSAGTRAKTVTVTRAELLERTERLTSTREAAAFLSELITMIATGKVTARDANAASSAVDRKVREWTGTKGGTR